MLQFHELVSADGDPPLLLYNIRGGSASAFVFSAERVSARLRAEVIVKAFRPFSVSKGARPVVDDGASYKFTRAILAVSQAGLGARVVLDIFAVDIAEAVGFVWKAVALCQVSRRALARAPHFLAPELARHGSLGGAAARYLAVSVSVFI